MGAGLKAPPLPLQLRLRQEDIRPSAASALNLCMHGEDLCMYGQDLCVYV